MKTLRLNWLLPVSLLLFAFAVSAFTIELRKEKVTGSGKIKTETRTDGPFKSISTSGVYNVYITPGAKNDIRIETDDNLLPLIETEVRGTDLHIQTKKGYDIKPTQKVNIYVTMSEVEELASSGSGGFYSRGKLKGDQVKFRFSGSTQTEIEMDANALKVEVSGSSKFNLKGNIEMTRYDISGSADVEALELRAANADINISGTGKLDLVAEKKLDVNVSGMGKVRYKGSPVINQSSSGMAKISRID
ncbi:head GIN domain-containing protein [Chitinophaga rhizophila]|uniref:DUF2807 domain-containing protein n=1 Tax=Chitinophaga rhizophila TaxID=2866212 RepID=A0ABS7GDV3_9BACT|nr:head GIN domain-containing protein [Chitinophaga rhizophila]MBW8684842.1 DUF2807 domain-containing protein [Chitinophaga rhizophila]